VLALTSDMRHESAFPRKRLVKFCTKRFRGNQRKGAFVNRFRDVISVAEPAGCCCVLGLFALVANRSGISPGLRACWRAPWLGAGCQGAARRARVRGPGLLRST
jgi:hypothetical protein